MSFAVSYPTGHATHRHALTSRFGQAVPESLSQAVTATLTPHVPASDVALEQLNEQSKAILKRLPAKDKLLTGLLHLKEQPESFSAMKFIQDTGILWVPKSLVSRSLTEWFEVTFTEFIESAYFYFAAPLSAQKGFMPLYHKLAKHKPDPKLLRTAIDEIPKDSLKHVLPLKTAVVLSSVGAVSVAGEYALNFVKNLITAKGLHQTNFSDVVALSKQDKKQGKRPKTLDTPQEAAQNKSVIEKANRRILQCLGAASALVGASVFLARRGAEIPALEKPLYQFVKRFDFNYGNPKKFGLTAQQLRWLIMPLAVTGYIDAARDKLERWEVTPRVILSGFYLAKGADMLENRILAEGKKRVPHLFDAKGNPKSINTIVHDSLQKSRATLTALAKETATPVTDEAVYQLSMAHLQKDLKAKNMLFYPQYLFGISVIGLAVALLNRHLTRERFERGFGAKTLTTTSPKQALTAHPTAGNAGGGVSKSSLGASQSVPSMPVPSAPETHPQIHPLNQIHLGVLNTSANA
jgi:hypothetical protein